MNSSSRKFTAKVSIISSSIIGGLFLYLTTHQSQYGSEECVYLRNFSHYYSIFALTVALFTLFLWVSSTISKSEGLSSGVDCIYMLSLLVGAIFFGSILIILFFKEPCGNLKIFSLIYLIIMTMLSCGSCCAMCLSLGVEDEN